MVQVCCPGHTRQLYGLSVYDSELVVVYTYFHGYVQLRSKHAVLGIYVLGSYLGRIIWL